MPSDEDAAYQLRPYEAADEHAVIALWHVTWQRTYPDIDFAARLPWWRARWQNELVPTTAITVAERSGTIIGFVTIDASGYLDQIVVAPAEWGSSVAEALLDCAKQHSLSGVTLKVNADNARAIRFYQRNGFGREGDEINPSSGRDVWRMKWPGPAS